MRWKWAFFGLNPPPPSPTTTNSCCAEQTLTSLTGVSPCKRNVNPTDRSFPAIDQRGFIQHLAGEETASQVQSRRTNILNMDTLPKYFIPLMKFFHLPSLPSDGCQLSFRCKLCNKSYSCDKSTTANLKVHCISETLCALFNSLGSKPYRNS